MQINDIYELYIYIANSGIDFKTIFYKLDPIYKEELLNYIEFLKKKPTREQFDSYKISNEAMQYFLSFVKSLIDKLN